jgi:hypothetical protein
MSNAGERLVLTLVFAIAIAPRCRARWPERRATRERCGSLSIAPLAVSRLRRKVANRRAAARGVSSAGGARRLRIGRGDDSVTAKVLPDRELPDIFAWLRSFAAATVEPARAHASASGVPAENGRVRPAMGRFLRVPRIVAFWRRRSIAPGWRDRLRRHWGGSMRMGRLKSSWPRGAVGECIARTRFSIVAALAVVSAIVAPSAQPPPDAVPQPALTTKQLRKRRSRTRRTWFGTLDARRPTSSGPRSNERAGAHRCGEAQCSRRYGTHG